MAELDRPTLKEAREATTAAIDELIKSLPKKAGKSKIRRLRKEIK
jgi:hypothetical protein